MIAAISRVTRAVYAIVVVYPLLVLAGCVAIPVPVVGEQMDSSDLAGFAVGSTTREEVLQVLKEPALNEGRFVSQLLRSIDGQMLVVTGSGGDLLPLGEKLTRVLLEFDELDILKSIAFEAWSRGKTSEGGTAYPAPAWELVQSGEVLNYTAGGKFKGRSVFTSVSFSSSGDTVVAWDSKDHSFLIDADSRSVTLLDPDRRLEISTFHGNPIPHRHSQLGKRGLKHSPQGVLIVSAEKKGRIRVLRATTGEAIASWTADDVGLNSLDISPDGKVLATSGVQGPVRFWDLETGIELGPKLTGRAVAFSPDGKYLAIATISDVALWRLAHKPCLNTENICVQLEGPEAMFLIPYIPLKLLRGHIPSLSFSSDSRMLAVVGGPVVIWDLVGKKRLWRFVPGDSRKFKYPKGDIANDIAFSPDGRTLAMANGDGVRFWEFPSIAGD